MTRTKTTVVVALAVVMVAAFVAWPPGDGETQTQQIDIINDSESLEIVMVSDDDEPGTTFYAPPAVGTESHDEWIEWYRTAEYEGMNALTRDIAVLQHDFEVRFNTDHDGPDVTGVAVALLVQMDRLSGEYDPTANEKLVHDWHITEHDPPSDPVEIYAALLGIIGTADNMHYAEALYDATNVGANFGYVPYDLHMQDRMYWHDEAFYASCEHFWDDCDADDLRASAAMNRELTTEEIADLHEHMDRDTTGDDDIIPSAYALERVAKLNTAYMVVWADRSTCTHYDQTKCRFQDSDDGIGWNRAFPASTDWHDIRGGSSHASSKIHYDGTVRASHSSGALSQYVYITAQFKIPSDSSSESAYGTTRANVSDSWNPPGTNHSYGAKARTYA